MSNKYLFNVQEDNPFMVFPKLQKKAEEFFSPNDMRDLSRGNPGLGFCPSEKGRKFFGFLTTIDSDLNSNKTSYRIHEKTKDDISDIEEKIKKSAQENFLSEVAAEHLKTLDEVVEKIISFAKEEGLDFGKIDVLHGIFGYSTLAGGTYHTPKGELVARIVVAGLYRHFLNDENITTDDITFTLGVNDAIGTLFKMLGKEGLGYLQEGDVVAVSAPAYAPYFNEVKMRGLVPIELKLNTKTGKADLSKLQANDKKIKAFFMINPNNPSGLLYEKSAVEEIAKIAEEHNAIIITDEIYALFHDDFVSVWSKAKNRTILLSGRSKIERSPGLRFGDVLISKETNKFLTKLLKDVLVAPDFKSQFIWMKAPGGAYGSFQHTASVPGPSQILGMLQILLGDEERKQYVEMVNENMDKFFEELGLPRNNAIYYGLFDLNTVPGNTKSDITIEQKLYELAIQKGVILVPALKFFSEAEQAESDKSNFVRVSLPNLPPDKVGDAARRIKEYLAGE